jgi:hypothetical protein
MGFFNEARPIMTTSRLQEQVLRIVIAGNLSFYFAENEEFKVLLKDAYPDCSPPTRKGLVDLLVVKADEARAAIADIVQQLDSKIHLAIDCWTSRMNIGYMSMTPTLR